MNKRLRLVEAPNKRAMCETKMRYDVVLDGQCTDTLYFNLTGYLGSLPSPKGKSISLGEVSLLEYRKEIALLNKEFDALDELSI